MGKLVLLHTEMQHNKQNNKEQLDTTWQCYFKKSEDFKDLQSMMGVPFQLQNLFLI